MNGKVMEETDWAVVGGGPRGACAGRALSDAGLPLRMVDPARQLLSRSSERDLSASPSRAASDLSGVRMQPA